MRYCTTYQLSGTLDIASSHGTVGRPGSMALENVILSDFLLRWEACRLQWPSVLARLAATPQVTGSRPTFGVCAEISFSSRYGLRHRGT